MRSSLLPGVTSVACAIFAALLGAGCGPSDAPGLTDSAPSPAAEHDVEGLDIGPPVLCADPTVGFDRLVDRTAESGLGDWLPEPSDMVRAIPLVAHDLDGDGDLDLAHGRAVGQPRILLNDGAGHFVPAAELEGLGDLGPSDARALGAGDFDGDGLPELLLEQVDLLDEGADEVVRWGLGCSGAPEALPSAGLDLPGDHRIVAAGDVDGDGDPDVVSADGAGALRSMLNGGQGTFVGADADATLSAGGRVATALADFDGDGRADLVSCHPAAGTTCELHAGAGDGTFGPGGVLVQSPQALDAPALGDFDGDGVIDLALAARAGGDAGSVWLFLGDGSGGLLPGSEVLDVDPALETDAGDASLATGDVDGGDVDLLLLVAPDAGGHLRELHVLLGDGAGDLVLGSSGSFLSATSLLDEAGGVATSPP